MSAIKKDHNQSCHVSAFVPLLRPESAPHRGSTNHLPCFLICVTELPYRKIGHFSVISFAAPIADSSLHFALAAQQGLGGPAAPVLCTIFYLISQPKLITSATITPVCSSSCLALYIFLCYSDQRHQILIVSQLTCFYIVVNYIYPQFRIQNPEKHWTPLFVGVARNKGS